IDRPIFASMINNMITLVSVIALSTLPIAQYPDIAPPTIQVTTNYPGANAKVVSETVATPIEQQVNGVENMLYMSSQSTSDGNMTLSITFKLGTNLDTAQVLVQNRVAIAIPVLPPDVQLAAGIIGAPPVSKGATAFQYTVSTQGRLTDEKQFGDIIVKTGANGQVTRVRDIARVELAARDYTVNSGLGGKPATAIAIYQLPGSNALATSDAVRKKMAELKQ